MWYHNKPQNQEKNNQLPNRVRAFNPLNEVSTPNKRMYPVYDTSIDVISDFFGINIQGLIKALLKKHNKLIVYDWGFGNARALKELELFFQKEVENKRLVLAGCSLEQPKYELKRNELLFVGDITQAPEKIPADLNIVYSYSSIHHIIYRNYAKTCHLGGLNLTKHVNEICQKKSNEFFLFLFTLPIPLYFPQGINHDELLHTMVNHSIHNKLIPYGIIPYHPDIDNVNIPVSLYCLIFGSMSFEQLMSMEKSIWYESNLIRNVFFLENQFDDFLKRIYEIQETYLRGVYGS
ncbi:MAG: hypothetical protein N3E37_02600 [Candidatus Micrarchaeota archaeon]|nr:hypothetical protein [Candidatus Micrarchaeota archaeon]